MSETNDAEFDRACCHDSDMWELCAYRLSDDAPGLIPAPVKRHWMEQTGGHFATRCLPMMMANQAGWFILNPHTVRVTWNGGPQSGDLLVEYKDSVPTDAPVVSFFGRGIVTWRIPFLFRTPSAFDLLVRGPANSPKNDVYALEGIVETDWAVSTFTMNWQIMVPNKTVVFDRGEPIAMIVPIRKADLEKFTPVVRPLGANPELKEAFQTWARDRAQFIQERVPATYQKDYVRGRLPNEDIVRAHRTRMHLRPFENG